MLRVMTTLCAVFFCSAAVAQLHFDNKEKITKASIGQKSYKASFKFTNSGTSDVTITKLKSSCVCTVADLKKRVYKPGESGEIITEIAFGREKGRFVKQVYVTTKSDKVEMITLSIGAVIPEFARINPRFIRWEHGSDPTTKIINVKIIYDEPIKVFKVTSSNPDWKTVLKTIKEGAEYAVEVTPSTTDKASRAAISIEMDYPKDQHLVFRSVARVTQPPAPEPKVEGWLEKLLK